MQYLVITKVPEAPSSGNLALIHLDTYIETEPPHYHAPDGTFEGKYTSMLEQIGLGFLMLRQEVFQLGEVLITQDGERECVPPGRKPSKWNVEYETFDSIEEAVAKARELVLS